MHTAHAEDSNYVLMVSSVVTHVILTQGGGGGEQTNKPVKAKLGEANSMYYDEEVRRPGMMIRTKDEAMCIASACMAFASAALCGLFGQPWNHKANTADSGPCDHCPAAQMLARQEQRRAAARPRAAAAAEAQYHPSQRCRPAGTL